MAELRQKVKSAINETRILILGSQILLGFQFHSAFRDAFDQLPARDRGADMAALALMLLAVATLIAPSAFHRIAEGGEDSGRLLRFTSLMATLALLPFSFSFGLNLLIAIDRVYGGVAAIAGGIATLGVTLFFWYGFELIRRRQVGGKERAMAEKQSLRREQTPLPVKIEQMLIEARVILPGAARFPAGDRDHARIRDSAAEREACPSGRALPRHAVGRPADGPGGLSSPGLQGRGH